MAAVAPYMVSLSVKELYSAGVSNHLGLKWVSLVSMLVQGLIIRSVCRVYSGKTGFLLSSLDKKTLGDMMSAHYGVKSSLVFKNASLQQQV